MDMCMIIIAFSVAFSYSVEYNSINVDDILYVHKYLMKKVKLK